MDRTRGNASRPSAAIGRGGSRGNSGYHHPRGRGNRSGKTRADRLWGNTPQFERNQSGMTELFALQSKLNATIARQARLLKVDASEVRSTEVEHLRRVNQQIVGPSLRSVEGQVLPNPFNERNLSDSQKAAERLILMQGKPIVGENSHPRLRPASRRSLNRRRTNRACTEKVYSRPLSKLTVLEGPLAPCFRRSVDRGYSGTPAQWLRSPTSAKAMQSLTCKGIIDSSRAGSFSLFERDSPLRWVIHSHSTINTHPLTRGFLSERLYHQSSEADVLVRQSRAVPRLPLKQWPRDARGCGWPTYPTLNESWEMMMRGKTSQSIYNRPPTKSREVPLRKSMVSPGSAVRVLAEYVLGLRADISVPRNLLGYFRYRWGFLILNKTGIIPKALASFLSSTWKRNFSGMFLRIPLRYSDALRRSTKSYPKGGIRFIPASSSRAPREGKRRPRRPFRSLKVHSIQGMKSEHSPSSESDHGVRLC